MPKARHTRGNTPHGGADFYPLLAKVGKAMLKELVLPVTHRFIQCWEQGKARKASNGAESIFQHRTL